MKALIFGIGGFVGSYLAKELQEHGYDVYGSDRVDVELGGVLSMPADILDAEGIECIITKVKPDVIINLAAISSVGQSWSIPNVTVSVNVVGALNILEASRKLLHKPKVMFIGSSEEYAPCERPINENNPLDANNPYGISKVTQERFAELYREQYGMKVYCVRPFNHTGVGQRDSFVLPSFCKQVAEIEKSGKSGIIKVGNLFTKRDFSHVKDVVRAYRMILESDDDTQVYNVGSGSAFDLEMLLEYIKKFSSQEIITVIDPGKVRPVDNPLIICDYSKIERELGWNPQFTVFDALWEIYTDYLNKN